MIISYHFSFDDGREMSFNVDLDRHYDAAKAKKAASWTALDNNKCQNCPLSSSDHQHCPAAVDLDDVIRGFHGTLASTKINVRVVTQEREYVKRVTLEEGARALMGLVMATSACPVFGWPPGHRIPDRYRHHRDSPCKKVSGPHPPDVPVPIN